MKNLLILTISIVLLSLSSCSKWTGKIKYSLDYELPEAYESQRAMLATEMTYYVGDGFTRVEQQSTIGDQVTISNQKTGVTTVLIDLMGKKIAISTEEVEDEEKVEPEIEYLDETKEIAGYKCKKVIYRVRSEDTDAEFEVYYTKELPAAANTQFKGIDGFPLEYMLEAQGMKTTYSAIEVTEGEVNSKLKKIPEGFEEMSLDEFMEMMGGTQ